jgi:hypothetical protein
MKSMVAPVMLLALAAPATGQDYGGGNRSNGPSDVSPLGETTSRINSGQAAVDRPIGGPVTEVPDEPAFISSPPSCRPSVRPSIRPSVRPSVRATSTSEYSPDEVRGLNNCLRGNGDQ